MASSPGLRQEVKDASKHWQELITDTRQRASRTNQTIIGVIGNTGDGKSSVINALLGEGSLLPTSCMRACTACVIELSYNHDNDELNEYRAVVQFISCEEWRKEIEMSLAAIAENDESFDEDDVEPETDVAKAIAKVRAVYADMDYEQLAQSSLDELMNHGKVQDLLGNSRSFKAEIGGDLCSMIEPFVDPSSSDDGDAAYWPLVKSVKIYTKADALSNGVTIVDLPGHQDWDAARTAVANEYIKSCAGIWIVAPIHRAVDNKTAKDLMGDAFKRQLKLDGSFSAVTFVCSKTDDIKIGEAMKGLRSKVDQFTPRTWDEMKNCTSRAKQLENDIKKLRKRLDGVRDGSYASNEDLRPQWHRVEHSLYESMQTLCSGGPDTLEAPAIQEQIRLKSEELDDTRTKEGQLSVKVHIKCIQKRNEVSKVALRQYLMRVVKEADQQAARQQGPKMILGQDQKLRHEKIANELKVFCVSSHAYQIMEKLIDENSTSTAGFTDTEDTEIPKLRKHAQGLTIELRITKSREVLGCVCQILNSIALWTQDASAVTNTIDAVSLGSLLGDLEKNLMDAFFHFEQAAQEQLQTRLFAAMERCKGLAISQAGPISQAWTAPPRKKSLPCQTLRAIFSRNGVYHTHDFNEDLSSPFKMNIANEWEDVFQTELPTILKTFAVNSSNILDSFHRGIIGRLGHDDLLVEVDSAVKRLWEQLETHKADLHRHAIQGRQKMNAAQKDANRTLTPAVTEKMVPVYEECMEITGRGTVKNMQKALTGHVRDNKHSMFSETIEQIDNSLSQALYEYQRLLYNKLKHISTTARSDYLLAVAAKEKSVQQVEARLKEPMMEILEKAEAVFK
nr:uncharacterized protein CTRU02_03453 [Colletotrichum truncatum]KAF6797422.1 hypothetical protein CTRU02_03453 [Colletotrichum truncatum]